MNQLPPLTGCTERWCRVHLDGDRRRAGPQPLARAGGIAGLLRQLAGGRHG